MKPTAVKHAVLKKRVLLITSPGPQSITESIKNQHHSQETPTISWHVYHLKPSKWRDNIFLVYCTSFFIYLFVLDMS